MHVRVVNCPLPMITAGYRRNFRDGSVTCRSLNYQSQVLALLRTVRSGQFA